MRFGPTGRRIVATACACAVAAGGMFATGRAHAQESPNMTQLQSDANAYATKIEQTTASYVAAEESLRALEEQIAQNEERSAELERAIPAQKARTAASVKSMYLFQQTSGNLLAIALSAESFDDFLTTLGYLDVLHARNITEVNNLTTMIGDLAQTRASLGTQRDEAEKQRADALAALEEARAARAELQAKAIAVAVSEQGDREAAIRVAQEALAAGDAATFVTSSGNTADVQVPSSSSVSTDPMVSNITSAESGDWAARINEYLEGSALEGYGATFAEAAAKYGVDPRLSPAIATIESGKGEICFRDHNAWGWGNASYADWESAIYDQVEGLAKGYDGTLTLEGAQRYCPPNAEAWYSSVANEMDGI